jgi:hypothetical protein
MKILFAAASLALVLNYPVSAEPLKTHNVVLIISDGLRWQEIFSGADPLLINDEKAGGSWTSAEELKKRYWNDDPLQRRKLLFPFLWGTVAAQGQLFGNQLIGSKAQVTNTRWFSYPGYNEMSSGAPDQKIDKNEFGPNPNVTVFEWLNNQSELHGKVEIMGTWQTFHDIFNGHRSGLPIYSGDTLLDSLTESPTKRLMGELYRTTTHVEDVDPFDSFLAVAVREHLKSAHPRVLFVGYGDTDNWAHTGRYDLVLETAHHFDQYVADLWRQMQADPQYRNQTTFIISADHGRGSGPVLWKDHGVDQPGSANIWIAVMGPDTKALGERRNVPTVTQSQIAATVAAFVGQDFRKAKPTVAAPLPVLSAN